MGWRFFRRVKLLPGVTLNLSRSGPSVSVGPRGLKATFGPRGTRTTVGLPGTGISYTEVHGGVRHPRPAASAPVVQSGQGGWVVAALFTLLCVFGLSLTKACAPDPPRAVAPPPPPAPPKTSARLKAEGVLVEFAQASGKARATVSPAFLALSREDQLLRCAALWEEAFGPPPGPGVLTLLRTGRARTPERPFATFAYPKGKASYRKLSAAPPR